MKQTSGNCLLMSNTFGKSRGLLKMEGWRPIQLPNSFNNRSTRSVTSIGWHKDRRMAKQCLFCENEANSKEHLWSNWILQRLGTQPMRVKMGKAPAKNVAHSVVQVRCVCVQCNSKWMSALESENIPIIGRLTENTVTPLDAAQQTSLALWTVMKAMVLDADTSSRETSVRHYVYTEEFQTEPLSRLERMSGKAIRLMEQSHGWTSRTRPKRLRPLFRRSSSVIL